jgi:hypothetical protein
MAWNNRVDRGEKVGLQLTRAERELLLTGLVFLYKRVEEAIRSTPPGDEVMLTIGDLEFLAGHVAGEANHAKSKQIEKVLGGLFNKIEALIGWKAMAPGSASAAISSDGNRGKIERTANS